MIRTIKILLSMIVISSLYAQYITIHPHLFSLSTFHIPMVFCDFLVIYLLKNRLIYTGIRLFKMPFKAVKIEGDDPIPLILIVLLGLSIVNMCTSGFAWFFNSYGIKDVCDTLRLVVCIVELLVLAGGGYYHRIFKGFNTNSDRRNWARNPGLLVTNRDNMDNICN